MKSNDAEFYRTHIDGKVQLYSRVRTPTGGTANNFIVEKDTEEEIDAVEFMIQTASQNN